MHRTIFGGIFLLFFSISLTAQFEETVQCKGIQMLEQGIIPYNNQLSFRSDELTDGYDITYHRLEWEIDPRVYYIKGKVTSYFVPQEDGFEQLNFNLEQPLQVNAVYYKGESVSFQHTESNLIEIYLPAAIEAGRLDSVTIDYEGAPSAAGIFSPFSRASHGPFNDPIIYTLSEPFGADNWWPCKQSLTDKIDSLDMLVRTPSQFRAAGNGSLVAETADGDFTTYHWKHRYPITTYLVATAVSNYQVYSDFVELMDGRQLEILNYVYPEFYDAARLTTPVTIPIMQLFEQLFGEYPFKEEKYGHAQFNFGGGIEHQTMSFMLDFRPGLVAHELAHQWFGDKVTCGTFNDIWVNEGFARYAEYLTHQNGISGTDARAWLINERNGVTSLPNGSVFVADIFSERRIFDFRLSYRKGGLILHMLRWKLGDEAFFQGLKNYLDDENLAFAYGIGEDVKYHLEQSSGQELDEFFDDWYYGEGYPTYTIMWDQNSDGKLQLTVEQETSSTVVDFFEMPLPIKVMGQNQEETIVLDHQFSGQNFTADIPFEVSQIEFDPELWILTGDNQVVFTTSNEEVNLEEKQIQVFPNPTNDLLYLQIKNPEIQLQSLDILHTSGQLIKSLSWEGPSSPIEVSDLPAGIYFLRIKTEESLYVERFIKN